MEEPGSPCVEAPVAASLRRKNKGKAPRPPAETQSLESSSTFDLEYAMMEQKENLDKEIELTVVLPDEVTSTSVSGSKPMMDLLIFLCAQYHLNPSAYTIDLVSADRTQVKFKPNTPVGMLEVEKVILKPKKLDDKNKKPTPVIPEQTVRVVINYKNTQKAVVRVSPYVSLQELIPIISSKCELDPLHTILMKDNQSQEPLDVTKSLNDLGLRDLYALDTSRESCQIPQNVDMQKQKEDEKGFFSFLRRSKKKREQAASAPATPLLTNQRPANIMKPNMTFKQYESNTLPSELPKKRRALLPPMYASQTVPKDFVQGQTRPHSCVVKSVSTDGEHKDLTGSGIVRTGSLQLSGTSSNDSSLRRAKRKAPPPPSPPCQPPQAQMDENSNETENSPIKSPLSDGHAELPSITAGVVFEYSLEEIDEKEESSICHKEASEATPLETPDVSIPALSTDVPLSTEEDKCVSTPENIASGSSKSPEEKQEPLNPDGKVMHSTSDSTDTGEMILENNTELLDLNKHEDKPENNILTVPGEEKENLTKTIEVHSTIVTQFIISKDDGTYENGILKNPPFIKDGKSKLNSTSTAVVKTQDAAIQTASSQTNDDQNISENIDPEGCTTGRVKEMGNVHWTVDKLPLKSTSSTHQSVQVETEFVAQRQETAVIKESSCAYTNDIFIPTESNMQSPIRSLSKGYAFYRHNSEPKPKPSNEITREYIPKIGMTTYKIVPQKSLEIIKSENLIEVKNLEYDSRLQGLETSESVTQSHFVYEPSADVRNRQYDTSTITDTNEVSPSKHCTNASQTKSSTVNNNGAPLLMLKKDTTNTSFEKKDKQNDTFPKARTNSFYSQLQRRVSGQYVTSAAAKSATSPTSPTQNEPAYKMTEENVPLSPQHTEPSTNRTIHSSELIKKKTDGSHYERKSDDIVIKPPVMPPLISPKPFTVPCSPSKPLSLQKLRTFTAPRPYSTTAPSPFALAVSSAVKRSQSFSKTCTTTSQPLKGDSINTFSSATSPTEVNNNSSESFLGSSNDRTLEQKKNFTNTENNNKVQYTPLVLEKKNTLLFQNSDPEQIRQSLLAAIRSGDAAAKLKRVCVQPNTISINGRSRLIHPVSTEVPYKQ